MKNYQNKLIFSIIPLEKPNGMYDAKYKNELTKEEIEIDDGSNATEIA